MAARFVAEEGDLKGLVLPLEEGDSWVIGRDPDECQLTIEDPLISRRHLIARRTSQGISVENLSTTNPIQVNEERVLETPHLLQNGDRLKIGNEVFRFYLEQPSPSAEEANDTPEDADEALPEMPNDQADEDTIFDDRSEAPNLAEIDFGLTEIGRWLLKVIGGPNTGAEFYMQAGNSYVIGTDPQTCDIVFHDTSVSRQHAKITVNEDDTLFIEDLRSRNGVVIANQRIENKESLPLSVIISVGTTSFVVYDREGEMQTIISPLMPSIVKILQQEEKNENDQERASASVEQKFEPIPVLRPARNFGPLILVLTLVGIFSLVTLATFSLFRNTEIMKHQVTENAIETIEPVVSSFPAVRFSYNKANESLLLLGHVTTQADKNQLIYSLRTLNFIKDIDDSGLIIDEFVWREINSLLSRNPAWQGVSIHTPAAGQFVVSGYLQTRKQAEQLSDYLGVNFPYLDLLKNQILVEEDVLGQVNVWLQQNNLSHVKVNMKNAELIFTGAISNDQVAILNSLIQKAKDIPGVRGINNLTTFQQRMAEVGTVNITDQYQVTGRSRIGNRYTVVLNGRIVSEGDILDGMTITKVTSNTILLEKDGASYRIDYTP